jgi:hypothetical protein
LETEQAAGLFRLQNPLWTNKDGPGVVVPFAKNEGKTNTQKSTTTMTIIETMSRVVELGLSLQVRGDTLILWPREAVPSELIEVLRTRKPELIHYLNSRAGQGWEKIPPTNLGLGWHKPQPSMANLKRVVDYLLRQGANKPGPLAAWLIRRENQYFERFGRAWPSALGTYAAARDAACWQTNRNEMQLWELLEGLEEVAGTMKDWPGEGN